MYVCVTLKADISMLLPREPEEDIIKDLWGVIKVFMQMQGS